MLALGVTLLMIGGEFDLSVGSVLGLSALLVPLLVLRGLPPVFAILIGLGVGALIGSIHGALVTVTHAPSLIVTLGGLMFWRGVVFALTGGFLVPVDYSGARLPHFFGLLAGISSLAFVAGRSGAIAERDACTHALRQLGIRHRGQFCHCSSIRDPRKAGEDHPHLC